MFTGTGVGTFGRNTIQPIILGVRRPLASGFCWQVEGGIEMEGEGEWEL